MKIENIDTTLEEIQEVGEQMRVINEAISQPVGGFQVCLWWCEGLVSIWLIYPAICHAYDRACSNVILPEFPSLWSCHKSNNHPAMCTSLHCMYRTWMWMTWRQSSQSWRLRSLTTSCWNQHQCRQVGWSTMQLHLCCSTAGAV